MLEDGALREEPQPTGTAGWRDFNDAGPQALDERPPGEPDGAAAIKARLHASLPAVLSYLLPAGEVRHGKFHVGDVRGNPGDSLVVELAGSKAGMWHDFATGEGGDILALWAAVRGGGFREVLADIRAWLDGPGPAGTEAADRPRKAPPVDDLGPVTGRWDYHDDDGNLIACVYRYDPPGGKQFRPWDVRARRMRAPEPRPLYNRPGLREAVEVVLVEGEKAARALIDGGVCATTAMNGAKAPVAKTDWAPLAGKRVLVWPDKDPAGWDYAQEAGHAALAAGAVHVAILLPPEDRPAKWDAADAVAEGLDVAQLIASADRQALRREVAVFSLADWRADRYAGPAPAQRFLVDGAFPLGVVALLAAMGDTGKGMMTLDLALQVATGRPRTSSVSPEPMAFGGPVRGFGTAVVLTAEDDCAEVHRRLARLDPEERRLAHAKRLIVVPLANAGGPMPLVAGGKEGPVVTEAYGRLHDQLMRLRELRLVVLDPLASFVHADVTADPAAGSFATGLLASLATETGAAVIVAHHMRKPQGNKPIATAEQARDAIRGTTAIVDGVRMAYALWPAPEEHQDLVFKVLDEPPARNAVFQGAVVKANGPADRAVRTYLRAPTGLLIDVTARLRESRTGQEALKDALVAAVARAAEAGHPFTHTGGTGVYQQRNRLPALFHGFGRKRLQDMVQSLLNTRPPRLVKGMAAGSKEDKWLDVPDGPFAKGVGEFVHGADEVEE